MDLKDLCLGFPKRAERAVVKSGDLPSGLLKRRLQPYPFFIDVKRFADRGARAFPLAQKLQLARDAATADTEPSQKSALIVHEWIVSFAMIIRARRSTWFGRSSPALVPPDLRPLLQWKNAARFRGLHQGS